MSKRWSQRYNFETRRRGAVAWQWTSAQLQGGEDSPGLLHLDAAAQLLQDELARVVVDDEHTVLLVRPLVSFEHRHGRRGALDKTAGLQCYGENGSFVVILKVWGFFFFHSVCKIQVACSPECSSSRLSLTDMWGNVMVTSSPFPTCSSPSQLVSMEAGLKSSGVSEDSREKTFIEEWAVRVNVWWDDPDSLNGACEDTFTQKPAKNNNN